jgi:hypothetical protein
MRLLSLLLLLFLCWAICGPTLAAEVLLIDDFEQGLAAFWSPKIFHGTTRYAVVADGSGHVLQADSQATASGLIYEREFNPHDWPVLVWRWKVAGIIEKGDARIKAGDDYAARVYVVFPHWFFPKTKSLNYIWANRLPAGSLVPNPFTGNAMMLAIASGPEKVGQWQTVRRNIAEDYRRAFGTEPPETATIALMTDTDNTGGTATAWYDDLHLEKLE